MIQENCLQNIPFVHKTDNDFWSPSVGTFLSTKGGILNYLFRMFKVLS
jgi:hypothetical protein